MAAMVEATISVDADVADALNDPANRQAMGRLVSDVLQLRHDRLLRAMAEISAKAEAAGFTEAELQAELADFKAERRGTTPPR